MDDWTDGYVTEVPYSVNHFPEMAPAHLRLALLQAGLAAPNTDRDFTYLELGFGQGLGLNMLAAAHPQGRFFGNDFMPAHVAAAQALADQAGLSNLQLVQDSFSQLRGRDLPPMDFIVLHGVYTWVNADNRAHIVALITRLLKPGGVVYLSYNCMPGWALKAPLQRLMSEAAQRQWRGSALQGFHAARDLLGRLDAADAAYFANNPGARTALRDITNASDAYLLHEFAPRGWTPFYCTDVAADMARADLQFAASAKLFSNFPQWSLPAELRAVIDATEDSGMRELLRDFAMQTPLRRDVFLRSPRTLNAAEIEQEYDATLLALQRPPASCARHVRTPITALHLEDDVVDALLAALAGGPQTIAALRALPALANASPASIRETLEPDAVPRLPRPGNGPESRNPRPRACPEQGLAQTPACRRTPVRFRIARTFRSCRHRLSRPTLPRGPAERAQQSRYTGLVCRKRAADQHRPHGHSIGIA
ncbi:MAG: class I SAM-dependent methyltransferase [Lysobacterales bacterium]